MLPKLRMGHCALLLFVCAGVLVQHANAASCTTQSQMTASQRDALAAAARGILSQVQQGDELGLRANTVPAVAADFDGIAASVNSLRPLVQGAAITVEELYELNASTDPPGSPRTDFFCGSPVVVLNFTSLPPGKYALAILHATGVPQPQLVSLILSGTAENRWMFAGIFSKAMIEAGHDGLWYWTAARKYAQKNMRWDAWLYYRMAADLLDPLEFLSSSNLQKLQHESEQVRPDNLPGDKSIKLDSHGSVFEVTTIGTTSALGALDLDVHYAPDVTQTAQLRDTQVARKQVADVMTALLALHPELQDAFHGMWVHADSGNASIFALELPMRDSTTGTTQ
jgi:hypothetical protein